MKSDVCVCVHVCVCVCVCAHVFKREQELCVCTVLCISDWQQLALKSVGTGKWQKAFLQQAGCYVFATQSVSAGKLLYFS